MSQTMKLYVVRTAALLAPVKGKDHPEELLGRGDIVPATIAADTLAQWAAKGLVTGYDVPIAAQPTTEKKDN